MTEIQTMNNILTIQTTTTQTISTSTSSISSSSSIYKNNNFNLNNKLSIIIEEDFNTTLKLQKQQNNSNYNSIINDLVIDNLLTKQVIYQNITNCSKNSYEFNEINSNMCISDYNLNFIDVLNSYAQVYQALGEEDKALSYLNESMLICSVNSPDVLFKPESPTRNKQKQKYLQQKQKQQQQCLQKTTVTTSQSENISKNNDTFNNNKNNAENIEINSNNNNNHNNNNNENYYPQSNNKKFLINKENSILKERKISSPKKSKNNKLTKATTIATKANNSDTTTLSSHSISQEKQEINDDNNNNNNIQNQNIFNYSDSYLITKLSNISTFDIINDIDDHINQIETLVQFRTEFGKKLLNYIEQREKSMNFDFCNYSKIEQIEAAKYLLDYINKNTINSIKVMFYTPEYSKHKGPLSTGILGTLFEDIMLNIKK